MEPLASEAERYLREVVEGHPIWVRNELGQELRDHLTESIRRRLAAGADPATAEAEALESFGPTEELRRQLVEVHRRPSGFGDVLGSLLGRSAIVLMPIDWLAPIRLLQRRPLGNFGRDYQVGRYDAIIVRGERELRERGPRFNLHHELGIAYGAIGGLDRSLEHYRAEVAWLQRHPLPRFLGRAQSLAVAYSNLAGILQRLERFEEADAAIRAGLELTPRSGFLNFQRAQRLIAQGDRDRALDHLEAVLDDRRFPDRERFLLFATRGEPFEPLGEDPRFRRILLRAVAA